MQPLIDILQGAGLAGASGIRPFLPALVAGALAKADVGIDYEGTPFVFRERPGWLLGVVLALIAVVIAERRRFAEAPIESALQGVGVGLGALLFAATLADNTDVWWPGLLAGGLCAALAVLVAPVSLLALGFLAFLLLRGRRREGRKYAGLRILR